MMVEMVLESSQDFSMSNGSLPQWKRELLQRRAARPRAAPPSPPPPPAPPAPRPAPDDDEELRYGPGIVKRLKSRYLSLALRDAPRRRPSVLRRAASLEHLLDDRPPAPLPLPPAPRAPRAPLPRPPPPARRRDLVKRARSVDALSRLDARDDPPEPPPPPPAPPRLPPDAPRAPRPPRRPAPLLREAERPPADVVRAALRKFEPAPRRAVAASLRPALRGLEARGEVEEAPRPVSRAALEGIARAGSTTRYSFPAARAGEHLPPLAATNPVLVGRARRVGVIRPMPAPDRSPDCDPASPDPVDKIPPESPGPRAAEEAPRALEGTPPPVEHSPRAERRESPPSALVEPTPRPPPDRSPPPVPTSPLPSAPEFILELADLEPYDAKPVPPRPEPRKIEFSKPLSPKPEPVARPRPAPEVMKSTHEVTKPIPEVTKLILEVTKPIPEVTKFILEATKPIPEVTKSILEVTKPIPEVIEPIPEVTKPTLEVVKPKSVPEVTKFIPVAEVAKPKPEPEVTKSKPVIEVAKPIVVPEVTKVQPVAKVVTNTTPLTNGHSEPARGRSGTVAAADTERAWSGAGAHTVSPGGAAWGSPGGARRGWAPPVVATSVVFNFSQRKEVPDYIENDGLILRASRRDRIKAGEPGVVVLRQRQRQRGAGAGSGSGSGSDSDSDSVDCSRAPSPLGVRFVNDNVLINGRSSMPARPDRDRQAKLRLQFDDSLTRTFEYPSETSLCLDDAPDLASPAPAPRAAEPLPPSAADPRQQLAEPAHLAPLASNTHIVSAALGRYTPHKTAAPSFQLGLRRDADAGADHQDRDATRRTNGDQDTDCGSPTLACDIADAGGCDVTLQQEQEQEVEVEGDARPCGADAARSWSDARTLATDLLF